MEQFVTIFVSLSGAFTIIAVPIIKLNSTLTRTNVLMEKLEQSDNSQNILIKKNADDIIEVDKRVSVLEAVAKGFNKFRD